MARTWGLSLLGIAVFQLIIFLSPQLMQRTAIATAEVTAWVLRLLGAEARTSGTLVSSSIYSIEIIWECTALFPIAVFVSAVLAYPCGWIAKAIGVLLGVPFLLAVNILRLVSLCYIGRSYPQLFESAHLLVWQSLFVFVTALAWIVWGVVFVGWYERKIA